jgi:hypothetical protein
VEKCASSWLSQLPSALGGALTPPWGWEGALTKGSGVGVSEPQWRESKGLRTLSFVRISGSEDFCA